MNTMNKNDRIYVAGHRGLTGTAICNLLKKEGFVNIITSTHSELELTNQQQVELFFQEKQPEYVFLFAAKVGGIKANSSYPAEFIRDNLLIQANVIDSAYKVGVKKLLFLGSSCIYPKTCPQPIKEEYLLTGSLEPTNEWYAVAKIAGIKMCQAYNKQYGFKAISLMPTNLYGPEDNFNLETSHVLPALLCKFHDAKIKGLAEVEVWGSGRALREFLHVGDLADAALFLMQNYDDPAIVNVGSGQEISIKALAELITRIVGYDGNIRFNTDLPDGTPRKLLDRSRLMRLGWESGIDLEEGITDTYSWYKTHLKNFY